MAKTKLIRITTVPISVEKLLGNQLSYMNQFFEVTAISSDKKELERIGADLGIKTYAVEMTRKITPFRDLKSLWKMYRYFRKEKPEIVHTHTPKAGLIGMFAAKLAGVKVRLHTVAGLPLMETTGAKRKILNFVEKITYSCASKVYPNSFGLKEFIIKENYCSEKKIKIIGNGSTNGIDTDYFNPNQISHEQKQKLKKQLGISEKDFVFIFVGRLVKNKGINELVSAFSQTLKSSNPHPQKLLLVGNLESELDPLLPETLKEIETNPDIIFVGFQSDVRPYFAVSDCLVFPSYREGFPNVVLQAGAMELPSITSDINGCNEIIKDEKNGIIIFVKDKNAIQQAMEKLLSDIVYYQNLKDSSRPMITSRYKQSVVWEAILREYNFFEKQIGIV